MKKKYKILGLILIIMFLSGCTVTHTITLNENNSIEEQLQVTETQKKINEIIIKTYGKITDSSSFYAYVNETEKNFRALSLNSYESSVGFFEFVTNENKFDEDTDIYSQSYYNSYFNSYRILENIFSTCIIEYEDKILNIKIRDIKEELKPQMEKIDKFVFELKTPFKLVDSNETKVEYGTKSNVYTWIFTDFNEINIQASVDRSVLNSQEELKINLWIVLALIFTIVLIGTIIVLRIRKQSKKNNKI